jgi:uncharacterized protein
MEMRHEFEVTTGVEETWATLSDLDKLSRCVPGAEMSEVQGDEYRGLFRIEVGPLLAVYRGTIKVSDLNAENHRAILTAGARDRNGNGNVRAVIMVTLTPLENGGTSVQLATDLTLTGNMLRLGQDAITGASEELFERFVENVHRTLLAPVEVALLQAPSPSLEEPDSQPEPEPEPDATADADRAGGEPVAATDETLAEPAPRSLASRLAPAVGAAVLVGAAEILRRVVLRRRKMAD